MHGNKANKVKSRSYRTKQPFSPSFFFSSFSLFFFFFFKPMLTPKKKGIHKRNCSKITGSSETDSRLQPILYLYRWNRHIDHCWQVSLLILEAHLACLECQVTEDRRCFGILRVMCLEPLILGLQNRLAAEGHH